MQVVRDDLGRDAEEPLVERERLLVALERLGVLEVADVLRDEGVAVLQQRERVLLLAARRRGCASAVVNGSVSGNGA